MPTTAFVAYCPFDTLDVILLLSEGDKLAHLTQAVEAAAMARLKEMPQEEMPTYLTPLP